MHRKLNSRGETIVEVLIAIAIMSAALGGAFAIATRSQRTVQGNQERYQATLIANQQADLIKLAQADDGKKDKIKTFTDSTKVFCFDSAGVIQDPTASDAASLDPQCLVDYGSPAAFQYRVRIQPNQTAGVVDTFVITVEWDSISSESGVDSVRLLYGT
jgi:Tfp pilus assembly protein PilV